jgi:hypothetical protein
MAQNRWISRLFRMARASRELPRGLLGVPVAALALVLGAQGQTAGTVIDDAATPQDVVTALHQMADRAGVIFVGRVAGVRRQDGGGVASGVVEVTFEVDQAIRGCAAGTPFVLREWAGLWEADDQRYRVGQRLLMLLHALNAAGMSSPVDGMDGAIPIVRGGGAPLAANSSARVAPPAVDLRWVGTKLLHPVSYGSGTARGAHRASESAHAVAQGQVVHAVVAGSVISAAPVTTLSASDSPGSASVPAQQASVDLVVGMLTSWQKVQHAVR